MNQHALDLFLTYAKEHDRVVLFEPPSDWTMIPDPRTEKDDEHEQDRS